MSKSPNAQCGFCGTGLCVIGDGSHPIKDGQVFCPGSQCLDAWIAQKARNSIKGVVVGIPGAPKPFADLAELRAITASR